MKSCISIFFFKASIKFISFDMLVNNLNSICEKSNVKNLKYFLGKKDAFILYPSNIFVGIFCIFGFIEDNLEVIVLSFLK